MSKENIFQDRLLFNLCGDEENTQIVKRILKSPLGLSEKVIKLLFDNKFIEIKNDLDSIKQFVAGITKSEYVGKSYKIANFYPYLFSFHQFFHSSYRARQGKTLEELFKQVLREANGEFIVPDKIEDKRKIMAEVFDGYDSKLDIDVVAKKSKGKVMALQLRSRDDTGGTTAKSSLVEALRRVMKKDVEKDTELFYLLGIWDTIKSNQKNITISKVHESLEPFFKKKISKEYFAKNIEKGIILHKGVILKLAYGDEQIIKCVSEWIGKETELDYKSMRKIIDLLEKSDDLWLSYTLGSLELENLELKGINNIEFLNKLLEKEDYDISNFTKNSQYVKLANKLTLKIIPKWDNDSIPVSALSEKAHYIRDLILLKFIYEIM